MENEDLHEMMKAARIGNWKLNLIENTLYWSPMIYEIHEVPEKTKIELEKAINFYHPDHRNFVQKSISKAIETEESWDTELKLLTAKGKTIWVRAIGKPIVEHGKVVGLKGLFQDINETKLKQQRIEESKKLMLEGQKVGRFGNWNWNIAEDSLQWSQGLYWIFNQTPDLLEASFVSLMSIVHPDDRKKLNKDLQQSIVEKRPHDLVVRIIWPDGSIRFMHQKGVVYYDTDDRPIRMSGTTQDITDRVLAERDLLESETILKEAEKIAHIGNWKWYIEEDRHIWSDERYRILGYEVNEVEPSMDLAIQSIHPEDVIMVKDTIEKATSEKSDYTLEYRLKTKAGTEKVVKENGKWLPGEGNRGGSIYLGTIQDVTQEHVVRQELLASLEALKRSNEELKDFAYVASHDLQEPLRVITSYLQLIEINCGDKLDTEGLEFMDITVNACIRMRTLINDLLALSRLETASQKKELINCQALVETICNDMKFSIEEAEAHISFKDLPQITGDSVQIRQLFQNLIANAIKFRKKSSKPVVHIKANKQANKIKFSVSDNGIGIATQYYERIFDIFKRLHTKEEFKGTGIGLAICKKIVKHHGGEITVKSKVGIGSTFIFTIDTKEHETP